MLSPRVWYTLHPAEYDGSNGSSYYYLSSGAWKNADDSTAELFRIAEYSRVFDTDWIRGSDNTFYDVNVDAALTPRTLFSPSCTSTLLPNGSTISVCSTHTIPIPETTSSYDWSTGTFYTTSITFLTPLDTSTFSGGILDAYGNQYTIGRSEENSISKIVLHSYGQFVTLSDAGDEEALRNSGIISNEKISVVEFYTSVPPTQEKGALVTVNGETITSGRKTYVAEIK